MKSKMISIARCLKLSCFDRISSSYVHTLTGADLNVHKQIAAVCVTGEMQDVDGQISKGIFTTSTSRCKLNKNSVWLWIAINRLGQRLSELSISDASLSLTVDELNYAKVRTIKCVQKRFSHEEFVDVMLRHRQTGLDREAHRTVLPGSHQLTILAAWDKLTGLDMSSRVILKSKMM